MKVNRGLGEAWNNLAVIYLGSGRKKAAEDAVRSAERAGFRVNPRLKDDIRAMKRCRDELRRAPRARPRVVRILRGLRGLRVVP
ncbi:MAG: hypothetical protein ABR606_19630 [Vicinamibacterales bacterium]